MLKKATRYEKPFYFPVGGKEYGFADLENPIKVVLPISKISGKDMFDSFKLKGMLLFNLTGPRASF